jgi:hypothetical protein
METLMSIQPLDFKLGEADNTGEVIERIYEMCPDFVVYRTSKSVRIYFDDERNNVESFVSNHSKVSVELAKIYSLLPDRITRIESINRLIARALSTNAAGDHEEAKVMLSHAGARILKLRIISGRLQYTFSSFGVASLTFVVMLLLNYFQSSFNSWGTDVSVFSNIAFCGALGGIISVSLGFSKLEVDIDADYVTNCLIGSSRIVISIAAAIFSYFALKSGVAFSFLADGDKPLGIYVVAMIAGFSEMLIPNIMTNLSSQSESNDKA